MSPSRDDPFDVTWRERLAVLGGAFGALAAAIALGLVFAPGATAELFGIVPVAMFAVGKFLPLWGISGKSQFGPYELGVVIWLMDTFTVLVYVYALEGLYRARSVKAWLHRIQANASLVLDAYPGLRKASRVGLVLFVLFPLAGTGALGATFVGILLRVHRATLIACVSFGGLLGGMLMAFAASNFRGAMESFQLAQDVPAIKYGIMAGVGLLVVLAVWWMNRAYQRVLARARATAPEQASGDTPGTPRSRQAL